MRPGIEFVSVLISNEVFLTFVMFLLKDKRKRDNEQRTNARKVSLREEHFSVMNTYCYKCMSRRRSRWFSLHPLFFVRTNGSHLSLNIFGSSAQARTHFTRNILQFLFCLVSVVYLFDKHTSTSISYHTYIEKMYVYARSTLYN